MNKTSHTNTFLLLLLLLVRYSQLMMKERTKKENKRNEMKCEVNFCVFLKTSLNSSLGENPDYIKVEEYEEKKVERMKE